MGVGLADDQIVSQRVDVAPLVPRPPPGPERRRPSSGRPWPRRSIRNSRSGWLNRNHRSGPGSGPGASGCTRTVPAEQVQSGLYDLFGDRGIEPGSGQGPGARIALTGKAQAENVFPVGERTDFRMQDGFERKLPAPGQFPGQGQGAVGQQPRKNGRGNRAVQADQPGWRVGSMVRV